MVNSATRRGEGPIAIVLGTRPEIIKLMPVIRACQARNIEFVTIHSGQHYSDGLDGIFFRQLNLPDPDYRVGEVGKSPDTGHLVRDLVAVLKRVRPVITLVQGDTQTVVAGALASRKVGAPVGHVEAGLRCGDRTMPEELNRTVTDHLSDMLFAPTATSAANLEDEGIPAKRVHVTGNTVVDAVRHVQSIAGGDSEILSSLGLEADGYILLTAHRQETVDFPVKFKGVLEGARNLGTLTGLPVIYPIHPRARANLEEFGLSSSGVRLIPPAGYFDFLALEQHARLVLTDSGGVQEETCILQVPCVTLRETTERPETVEVGSSILAGTSAERITQAGQDMLDAPREWEHPFGDGRSAERILRVIEESSR